LPVIVVSLLSATLQSATFVQPILQLQISGAIQVPCPAHLLKQAGLHSLPPYPDAQAEHLPSEPILQPVSQTSTDLQVVVDTAKNLPDKLAKS